MLRLECYFEAESVVLEHEGWADVIDTGAF